MRLYMNMKKKLSEETAKRYCTAEQETKDELLRRKDSLDLQQLLDKTQEL